MPDGIERDALVRLDYRELDDFLALGHLHTDPTGRPLPDLFEGAEADFRAGIAHVQRDAGRFDLHRGAGVVRGDLGKRGLHFLQQLFSVVVDGMHEADIEFRAVATDELHLDRESGQCREISQRAAGNNGCGRSRKAGERAQRAH